MVGFKHMGFSSLTESPKKKKTEQNLGILAFETAKTMSRLLSIYKSVSNDDVLDLRKNVMKSEGVLYLNSSDEGFLLSLACAERIEDLDRVAVAVARLGKKCEDLGLNRFDLLYTDLKLGLIDLGKFGYGTRAVERKVRKMERLVSTTSCFHASLEGLTEMEVSERKMQLWKKNRQLQAQIEKEGFDFDSFYRKLENQRKEVRHFREASLWCQTFDKSVDLMARIVCVVYARICVVFGPYVPVLTSVKRNFDYDEKRREFPLILPFKEHMVPHSGPMLSSSTKPHIVRFYSQRSLRYSNDVDTEEGNGTKNNRVFHFAGPATLGGSGLAMRYANVIILAEKYLNSTTAIDHDERESLYQMLPENLKALIRTKLSKNVRFVEEDVQLAEGWRGALVEMMGWLAPMAHNTLKWQMERNFERTKFSVKPSVLLLQTLHFSDREKTEAAIAEVLVGLSCIYRFENRHC